MRKVAKLTDLGQFTGKGMGVTDAKGAQVRVIQAKPHAPAAAPVPTEDHAPSIAALQTAVRGQTVETNKLANRSALHGKAIRSVLATLDEVAKPKKPRNWTFTVERNTKGFLESITATAADKSGHTVRFDAQRDSLGRIKKIVTTAQ